MASLAFNVDNVVSMGGGSFAEGDEGSEAKRRRGVAVDRCVYGGGPVADQPLCQ
jgi:hypothetical protein